MVAGWKLLNVFAPLTYTSTGCPGMPCTIETRDVSAAEAGATEPNSVVATATNPIATLATIRLVRYQTITVSLPGKWLADVDGRTGRPSSGLPHNHKYGSSENFRHG